MAEIILTLPELNDLFYGLTVAMINSTPIADVRLSWPEGGAPGWGIEQNVIFLKVKEVPLPNEYHVQREDVFSSVDSPEVGIISTGSTRGIEVNWIFYGRASWENAFLVSHHIFHQEYHNTLAENKMYLIPNFDPPRRLPEIWQGLWYQRMDLTMKFNGLVVEERETPIIITVPLAMVGKDGEITITKITP